MIAGMVKHHPIFRGLPKLLGISLLGVLLVANLLIFRTLKSGEVPVGSLILVQIVVMLSAGMSVLFKGGAPLRTNPWYLGLPVPSETLWRAHYLSMLVCLLTLVAFQGMVVAGFVKMIGVLEARTIIPMEILVPVLVRPALVMIFIAGMVAAYRSDLADLADAEGWPRYRLMVLAMAVVILVALSFLHPVVGLFPAVWGASAACRGRRSLPAGLSLGNGSAKALPAVSEGAWQSLASAPATYRADRPFMSLGILNQLFKVPYPWVLVFTPMTGFFVVLIAGFSIYEANSYPEVMRLSYFFLTIYLMFAFSGEFVLRLHRVDALPVDRRVLLRYLVFPSLAVVLLSYGGTRLWIDYSDMPEEKIDFQDSYGKFGPKVSPGFNYFASKGDTVTVVAPWGETHVSVARHPVPAYPSPLRCTSDFLTEGVTSRKFLAWQFSRAVEEVYGVSIEPAELDARYIKDDEDGRPFVPKHGFTVARDYGLIAKSGGPVAPFLLTPLLAGLLGFMGVYFRLLKNSQTIKWARGAWWMGMASLFVLHILDTFSKIPLWNGWAKAVLVFTAARRLGDLGVVGYVLAYGIGLALVWLAWTYCSRMFLKVEAPRD